MQKLSILMLRGFLFILFGLLLAGTAPAANDNDACTIGVAAGKATVDGRPLVWKTRDLSKRPDNEVYFNSDDRYAFLSIVNAGYTYAWMGLNEKGFAIVNAYAGDLPRGTTGLTNGLLMRTVLGRCASVAEFQHFLDSTNVTGRKTQANFAVIDASGAAAIFETANTFYRKFDANDTTVTRTGTLVRTNFSVSGGGHEGLERYNRSQALIRQFVAGDSLSAHTILRYQMRDFSDFNSQPVPVPYPARWRSDRPFGYIYTGVSICRAASVSAVVVHGVKGDENPLLSTFWAILGQPAAAIAVPYWPVADTPHEADGDPTAPLCDVANQIKKRLLDYTPNSNYIDSYKLRDEQGNGLWAWTFPAEDSIFAAAKAHLTRWYAQAAPPVTDMTRLEDELASYAFRKLKQAYAGLVSGISEKSGFRPPGGFALLRNYPNPFNSGTTISLILPEAARVTLQVYDVTGRRIQTLFSKTRPAGTFRLIWNPQNLPSGVYFSEAKAVFLRSKSHVILREKMVLLK